MSSTRESTPAQSTTPMRHTLEASLRSRRETLGNNPGNESGGGTSLVARDSLGREIHTLFCGAEQPFTNEDLDQASSGLNALSASLGIHDPPRQSRQLVPKSNGCGTQIHRGASSALWVWTADATGVSDTVVPLEAQYVPPEKAAELEAPQRDACGCSTQFVGCAVCGNPLGSRLVPCQTHALPNGSGAYTFLPSAVSPPLSSLTPRPVTAWDHERERLAERLRSRANYAPDGRRIPREPPALRNRAARRSAAEAVHIDTARSALRRAEAMAVEEEWVTTAESQPDPLRYRFMSPANFDRNAYRAILRGEQVPAPNTPATASTPTSAVRDRDHPVVQFAATDTGTDMNIDANPWFEVNGSLRLRPGPQRQSQVEQRHPTPAQEQLRQQQLLLQEAMRLNARPRAERLPTAGMELPAGATTRALRVGRVSGRAGRAGADAVGAGGAGAGVAGGWTLVMDADSGSDWDDESNAVLRTLSG
ncbi:hypothetical protein B0H16DRAFT_650539 [Mycena metata]|uniref:Uncharacterized protein n=1 Tax=Mycena metata TaxID=1033252 RepID=A0AAD7J9E4_9AGAR|nr:hypothetical protein B0H16DRAFT_650539 [Mycena metata]